MSAAKQIIRFELHRCITMMQVGGRGWSNWLQVWEGTDGNIYKAFSKKALMVCNDCEIEGEYAGTEEFKGKEQIRIKKARVVAPAN